MGAIVMLVAELDTDVRLDKREVEISYIIYMVEVEIDICHGVK